MTEDRTVELYYSALSSGVSRIDVKIDRAVCKHLIRICLFPRIDVSISYDCEDEKSDQGK